MNDLKTVVPHTESEFIAHLRVGTEISCPVCGNDRPLMSWTDFNGQLRCHDCGCTKQVIGGKLKEEWLASQGLTPADVAKEYCDCFEWVPLLKAYHQATGNAAPWGTYLGEPSWMPELREKFYRWLTANAVSLRPAWEDFFQWDRMIEAFATPSETAAHA